LLPFSQPDRQSLTRFRRTQLRFSPTVLLADS